MRKLTTFEFTQKAIKIHDNRYCYDFVDYKGNKFKIDIICPSHGKFLQTPHQHLRGEGCSKCLSKTQTLIYNICKNIFPDCEIFYNFRQFDWLRFKNNMEIDIFIPAMKLGIEYDGIQHFEPVRFHSSITEGQAKSNFLLQQERDNLKNCLIKKNADDIKYFIRFSYTEIITEEYVKNKILRSIND